MMVLHDNSDVYQVRKNSEWYDEMPAKQLISLMSIITHDRLVSREMFKKRIKEGKEIYEHELIYPILQAYDSVILESDLTIIGSDQLFNEMLGRFLQERYNQKPQVIITTKITPGIDGKNKQSKSLGNYIGLNHSPREKFGRIMSMPDFLVIDYFKVYTEIPLDEINSIELEFAKEPMKYKLMLAKEIVSRYHNSKIGEEENEWFIKTFRQKESPKDLPVVCLGTDNLTYFDVIRKYFASENKSNSEIKRLFQQNAIRFDGKTIKDPYEIALIAPEGNIIKVGSRIWFKVTLSL
jgi:tyrosyl-tRNA synthetase